MVNINFVPDDYVQSNESSRTNLMYLVLLLVVMTALGGSFLAIKIRQRACNTHEKLVNERMERIQETIEKFEELQTKRRAMMKTALTTAELLEPVPRSVLVASLTNNLPVGVSLTEVGMVQKEPKKTDVKSSPSSKYQAAQGENSEAASKLSPEQMLETHISIGGMAPTDLQVASYIERLSNSNLLDDVALVESKEFEVNDSTFRQFKLTAMLRRNVHLTKEDVDRIKGKAQESIWNF